MMRALCLAVYSCADCPVVRREQNNIATWGMRGRLHPRVSAGKTLRNVESSALPSIRREPSMRASCNASLEPAVSRTLPGVNRED